MVYLNGSYRVVVVSINGGPFAAPWIAKSVATIVEAWLPGEVCECVTYQCLTAKDG